MPSRSTSPPSTLTNSTPPAKSLPSLPHALRQLLSPYVGFLRSSETSDLLFETVVKEIFETMLLQASTELREKDEEKEEEEEEEGEGSGAQRL